jgi:hypothetical protein
MKPNINSVEVHPQLSHNLHPVEGGLVGALEFNPFFAQNAFNSCIDT